MKRVNMNILFDWRAAVISLTCGKFYHHHLDLAHLGLTPQTTSSCPSSLFSQRVRAN